MIRRVRSSFRVAVLVLGLGACSPDEPDAATRDATGTPTTGTVPVGTVPLDDQPGDEAALLDGYLDALIVAEPDPARPDYDRDTWEEGLDVDGDCVRTRHEVLTEESHVPVRVEDCKVVDGAWTDPLTGQLVDDPLRLEVDHLVALADAHRSGGWAWDAIRKAAFANALDDPGHLNAVLSAENQRKADDGPESYRPDDAAAWCWYATAYARVKSTWELTVTAAQMAGLRELAASCVGT